MFLFRILVWKNIPFIRQFCERDFLCPLLYTSDTGIYLTYTVPVSASAAQTAVPPTTAVLEYGSVRPETGK